MKQHQIIHEKINSLKEWMTKHIDTLYDISDDQKRAIIRRYVAAIQPNFIVWLSAAHVSCNSSYAQYACRSNLVCEISEDHRGMLYAFARDIDCLPSQQDDEKVATEVDSINKLLAKYTSTHRGFIGAYMMALLENTSCVFIPWLEKVAIQLGATDLRYTQTHGEADIEHADQFVRASIDESIMYHTSDIQLFVDQAFSEIQELLRTIFCS
jgi:hypothetical protein